jgi:chromosome segregation ATPase
MGSGDITKEYDKLDRILAELAEIRGTINGFGNQLASVKTELASVKTEVASVKTEVASVKTEVAAVKSDAASNKIYFETRFDSLERRLGLLEERFEKKLVETKPVWVAELDAKIERLRREITPHMETLAGDLIQVRSYQRDLAERLTELEQARKVV